MRCGKKATSLNGAVVFKHVTDLPFCPGSTSALRWIQTLINLDLCAKIQEKSFGLFLSVIHRPEGLFDEIDGRLKYSKLDYL